MGIKMKNAEAIFSNFGFEKNYSATFLYFKKTKGTECIMSNVGFLPGAVIYLVSIGGIVAKAKMVIEVPMSNWYDKEECQSHILYPESHVVHVKYDIMDMREMAWQFFQDINSILADKKPKWKVLPSAEFLDFTFMEGQAKVDVWSKLQASTGGIRKIWAIPKN